MPIMRRVFPRPLPLAGSAGAPPRLPPSYGTGGREGDVRRLYGPYRISGGWWRRTVRRDYYYAETERGVLVWLYYDRPRRRWFLQGELD